jgi:hypothetical protein
MEDVRWLDERLSELFLKAPKRGLASGTQVSSQVAGGLEEKVLVIRDKPKSGDKEEAKSNP